MKRYSKTIPSFVLVSLLAILAGCSGGSGEDLVSDGNVLPEENGDSGIVYNGPAAENDDIANFKQNVWDNLAGEDRCGACHNAGGQSPQFVHELDINEAYQQIGPYVDFVAPSLSRIVEKVAGGHNCWGDQPSVCGEILTNYLEGWISAGGGSSENVIVLTAPEEKEVGASLSFPEDSAVFASTIYPVVRDEGGCAACHAEDGSRMRQQPYFASANIETAYLAAQSKINLNDAAALREPVQAGAPQPSSRLLVRVRDEGHNCWADPDGGNACAYSASEMQAAIAAFLNQIPPPDEISEDLQAVASRAVNLVQDGVIASSGGRFESNVIALYEFKFGEGGIAFDYSGVEPTLDLNLSGDYSWVGSWGVRFEGGKAQGNTVSSKKLNDRIKRTGEYALEAWVIPANVSQDGPARIVTYSGDGDNRNFTLGQTLYNYDFMSRSSEIDQDDLLSTPDADEILQATLQHVVVNYDPIDGRTMYVNGDLVAVDETPGGNLNDWNDTYALALGSEVDGMDNWAGTIRLLAIHERTLTEEQVQENFDAGVGQKYYLLFGVSHLVDMPEAFVVFQVEVFDDYSYLFNSPFFISLDKDAVPPAEGIRLSGMRLGINGQEASLGQAYSNMDFTVTGGENGNYNADTGTPLSTIGTVIASEQGSNQDEFFLTFEVIGDNTYARAAPTVPDPEPAPIADQQSDFGTRNFGEINATLASMTTVSANNASVKAVYNSVLQQLPQVEDLNAFLPAHQAGIMQLAVAYCTALVNDTTLRSAYFPDFNFGGSINSGNMNTIIEPLLTNISAYQVEASEGVFTEISNQPSVEDDGDVTGTRTLLTDLLTGMTSAGTERAVIAACTSVAGSAVMLMQ